MKRSDVVEEMIKEYDRWQDQDAKFGGGRKAAMSSILKAMESLGMLPPLNNWSLYTDGDNADTKSIIYRTWEPEDDSSK